MRRRSLAPHSSLYALSPRRNDPFLPGHLDTRAYGAISAGSHPLSERAMSDRHITRRIRGMDTSDGAGVKLKRVIGQPGLDMLDPSLLLDKFRSAPNG